MEVKHLIMQVVNWKCLHCGFSCLGEETWEQSICLSICAVGIPSSVMYSSELLVQEVAEQQQVTGCVATKLPGEGFELAGGKWSVGLGFL